jgi:thioredoxin-dependent peroxiredoxin
MMVPAGGPELRRKMAPAVASGPTARKNMKIVAMVLSALVVAAVGMAAQTPSTPAPGPELKAGDPAPDFSLPASDGKTYKLSDFKGKQAVVVAWFPKASTQGCTIECKSLAENGHLIRKYNVTYFMASVDPLEDNTKFAKSTSVKLGENVVEKKEADFPILSDPTKKTAEAYGVLNAKGMANRWTFYIGKDGKILAVDKAVKPATSAEDMASKLGELQVDATK